MKFAVIAVLAGMTLAPLGSAQKLELKFDAIAAKASEKAEVDLDANLLKIALPFLGQMKAKGGKSQVSDLFNGVREVHIRSYEFEKAGSYSDKDLEPLRKQVGDGSGWSRILNAKEKDESAEIFVYAQGDKVGGCLIVAAEAKELAVIYLMGTLTTAQAKELVDSNVVYNLAALSANIPKDAFSGAVPGK